MDRLEYLNRLVTRYLQILPSTFRTHILNIYSISPDIGAVILEDVLRRYNLDEATNYEVMLNRIFTTPLD